MLRHVCLFQMFLGNSIYVFRDVMLIIYAYSRKTKFVNHFQESWTYHIAAQLNVSYAKRNRFLLPYVVCVNLPLFQHKLRCVLLTFGQYDLYRRQRNLSSRPVWDSSVLILHYYKWNKLAIIIIYNEQRACWLIVTNRMSTIAENCGLETHE